MSLRNRAPAPPSPRSRSVPKAPRPTAAVAAAIYAVPDFDDAALALFRRIRPSDVVDSRGVVGVSESFSEDDDCSAGASLSQLSVRSIGGGRSVRRREGGEDGGWPWAGTGTAPHLAFIFVLCAAVAFASTYYGAGGGSDDAAAAAAAQMMRLLQEVGSVDERARYYEEEERRLRGEVEKQRGEIERLREREREEEEEVRRVDQENRRLKRELEEEERRRREDEEKGRRREEEAARRLRGQVSVGGGAFTRQIQALRDDLQEHNRQEILDKYGEGSHLVRVLLDFPESAPGGAGPGAFVIEMAPIELLPHSVLHFLDQVRFRLWDGCSFEKNALHAVTAAPVPYDRSDPEPGRLEQAFRARSLHSLAFREYSEDFPHSKYTVGFDGHPGGPGWFVNVRDNYNVFGKGPPPAFGKVTAGIETVERLRGMPVEAVGIHKVMLEAVGIVSMRIVEDSHG